MGVTEGCLGDRYVHYLIFFARLAVDIRLITSIQMTAMATPVLESFN